MTERQMIIQLSDENSINYNPYTGEYLYQIPELLTSQQNTFYIRLISAVIPRSWYDINSTNNSLQVLLNSNQYVSIQIPIGNYDGKSFAQIIQSTLNISQLSVTFDSITSKLQFSYNLPISIIYLNTNYQLMEMLGFSNNENILGVFSIQLNKYIITSTNPINLSPISHVCVILPDIDLNSYILSTSYFQSSVLTSIPVDASPMNKIIYENQSTNRINTDKSNLQNFKVKLTDQYGNIINFNGIHWYINILFQSIRFVDE